MRRIVAFGSLRWTDQRKTMAALRRVMDVFKGPYTLVCDGTHGAATHAAAGATQLGWTVVRQDPPVECAEDCPPGHRRVGGLGTYCPTARRRNLVAMLDDPAGKPDLVIVFRRPQGEESGERSGQDAVRARGISLWDYESRGLRNGNAQD